MAQYKVSEMLHNFTQWKTNNTCKLQWDPDLSSRLANASSISCICFLQKKQPRACYLNDTTEAITFEISEQNINQIYFKAHIWTLLAADNLSTWLRHVMYK